MVSGVNIVNTIFGNFILKYGFMETLVKNAFFGIKGFDLSQNRHFLSNFFQRTYFKNDNIGPRF
jgi:hypothetical protein